MKFIGGIGTKGRKAHAYVCAHREKCLLEVTWKKNKKPNGKILGRKKFKAKAKKALLFHQATVLLFLNSRHSGWSKQPMTLSTFLLWNKRVWMCSRWMTALVRQHSSTSQWQHRLKFRNHSPFLRKIWFWGNTEGKTETNPRAEIFQGK